MKSEEEQKFDFFILKFPSCKSGGQMPTGKTSADFVTVYKLSGKICHAVINCAQLTVLKNILEGETSQIRMLFGQNHHF